MLSLFPVWATPVIGLSAPNNARSGKFPTKVPLRWLPDQTGSLLAMDVHHHKILILQCNFIYFKSERVAEGKNSHTAPIREKFRSRQELNPCARIRKLCGGPDRRLYCRQVPPTGGFRWINAALRPGRMCPIGDVRQPPLPRFFAHRAPKIC